LVNHLDSPTPFAESSDVTGANRPADLAGDLFLAAARTAHLKNRTASDPASLAASELATRLRKNDDILHQLRKVAKILSTPEQWNSLSEKFNRQAPPGKSLDISFGSSSDNSILVTLRDQNKGTDSRYEVTQTQIDYDTGRVRSDVTRLPERSIDQLQKDLAARHPDAWEWVKDFRRGHQDTQALISRDPKGLNAGLDFLLDWAHFAGAETAYSIPVEEAEGNNGKGKIGLVRNFNGNTQATALQDWGYYSEASAIPTSPDGIERADNEKQWVARVEAKAREYKEYSLSNRGREILRSNGITNNVEHLAAVIRCGITFKDGRVLSYARRQAESSEQFFQVTRAVVATMNENTKSLGIHLTNGPDKVAIGSIFGGNLYPYYSFYRKDAAQK
jgi:hypothetical protein